jgi:azurin
MKPFAITAALGLATASLHAAARIEIGTLVGKMKYDVENFRVDPGEEVTLVFTNTDEMQHNLILITPGPHMPIAEKAWLLGAEAVEKHYVPEDPRVLHYTKIIDPGQSETITFTAPSQEGDYPYVCTIPGHAHLMHGIMRVGSNAPGLHGLKYEYFEGQWSELPDFRTLEPVASGNLPDGKIDIGVARRDNHFGLVFTATLEVPADGEYTFYLNSDDGSRILVNDTAVVTYDGIHAAEGERNGRIALTQGAHPIRIEFFEHLHGQVLHAAWEGPGLKRMELSKEASPRVDGRFRPEVTDSPLIIRAFLENGPPRAISVGLPGGTSFCFDPEIGAVAFGWTGGFLDVTPDRGKDAGGRGGGWCKVLGERFPVGTTGFPIRFASPESTPKVSFSGYRRSSGPPEFHLTADGIRVRQTIRAASTGTGLEYTFEIDSPPADVFFAIDPAGLDLKSSAGTWDGGTLKIPATEAARFTVTLTRR